MAAALDQIKKASKLAEKEKQESLKQSVAFASDVIVQKEANARKENDFIYHERVPKPDDLHNRASLSLSMFHPSA